MKKIVLAGIVLFTLTPLFSQNFVVPQKLAGSFPIVSGNAAAGIYVDANDHWVVQKAASLLQEDIQSVTGIKPAVFNQLPSSGQNIILIGSMDNSSLIKKLIADKKLNADGIKGKWEAFTIQVVSNPMNGIKSALVIAGSDRRGTAYGVFELSKQAGVSPWYWWADVPVKKNKEIFVKTGVYKYGSPSVKYRGIFINDEAPAFSGWTKEKFGGVNHQVYEKIFELLLRLKANYLWPAMWGNAFNDDDTLNPVMADKYGIVMGTSHHEPMLRAQQEWKRYGKGEWNYETNDSTLRKFWTKGIQNMGKHESIVTIGMRGDGDKPMTQGTAIGLLERIVSDQRKILEQVTGKPASETPQLWALYKEVQDYYDQGMRVPDDVTLLLCDDNWGDIRRLPKLTDKPRPGGYGIYYHFDYVGGPRNYKWLNTNNIARVWEQMHLAYEYGVNKIWIVNVGDLKPMEFPISFFLDYAWDTKKWNADNIQNYFTDWASQQFGPSYAKEIGQIIQKYSQFNARRKPELLDANTYSLHNYDELRRVTDEYDHLLADAKKVNDELPAEYKDAYFELVLHPVMACDNLQKLYTAVAYNRYFASEHWEVANKRADDAKRYYNTDSLISVRYNVETSGGKWDHMMDQTHIGYTYWQQPNRQRMPDVKYVPKDSAVEQSTLIRGKINTSEDLIPKEMKGNVFYEQEGYVSLEAEHYSNALNKAGINWKVIPGIGKDGSGITTFPVTVPDQQDGPHLEYVFYTYDTAQATVNAYFSPTLNFRNDDGLKYAIAIDDEKPQIFSINKNDNNTRTWEGWVANNIIINSSQHGHLSRGKHVLKYWMVSPGVVLQKLVVDLGGLKPSYLGPPETLRK
jgi:hypothetical protein